MSDVTQETTPPHDGLLDVDEQQRQVRLQGADRGETSASPGTFKKIALGMVTLVALIVSSYAVPGFHRARPWTTNNPEAPAWLQGERDDPVPFWNLVGRELLGEGVQSEQVEAEAEVTEELAEAVLAEERTAPTVIEDRPKVEPTGPTLPPYQPHPDDAQSVPQPIELGNPKALARFFARLTRTDAGYAGAVTRVIHWGDSVVAADHISSTLRSKMQTRFGDAGHGFHLLAKPNASYRHRGVEFSWGEDWSRCYIINKCKSDGLYGLGGTTVWSSGGAESRFSTSETTPNGRKVSRFELWYLAEPRGGDVRLRVDDEEPVVVSTASDTVEDRWHTLEVEDGPHRFQVRAAGGGRVRLYGVVLERDVPGVVWDGMEQLGAFSSRMLYFDADHLRAQVDHRDASLLVFMFGGNDLLLSGARLEEYANTFKQMLQRFRGSKEPVDCLVMSPVDHGIREGQRIVSNPMVAKITAVQREVALAEGCAFFDSQAAMGGDGSVARWRRSNPPRMSGDLAHLTDPGQKVLGHMVYLALMQRYVEYRAATQ